MLVARNGRRHRAVLRHVHDYGDRVDDDVSAVDALGLMLPGASSIPAADSAHLRMATAAGRRIVEMVWEDVRPRGHPVD